jgi:hypothetical protein
MIFTRRFGALAARPTFESIADQGDLDRELHDLLNDADVEPVDERAN